MFGPSYQRGCASIFYSLGSSPLSNWSIHTANGYVKRIHDDDLKSIVLEIMGSNVSTMYMETPKDVKASLGIKLPFLVLLIKNMSKYFSFEVKILDDTGFYRRFRASNFQSCTSVKPFSTAMPMGMSPGWNQIHFNLADFTRRAYGTSYLETVHLQVHANCRIRRIYFTDRLYTEDELPNEYRLNPKPKERKVIKDFKIPSARPPSPSKTDRLEKTEDPDAGEGGADVTEAGAAGEDFAKSDAADEDYGAAAALVDETRVVTGGSFSKVEGGSITANEAPMPIPSATLEAEPTVTAPAADKPPSVIDIPNENVAVEEVSKPIEGSAPVAVESL